MVALDLAVGLWPAWPDESVRDPVGVEELAEGAVVAVDEGVVGEQPLRLDPELVEVRERPLDEAGDRLCAFVRWSSL